MLAKRRRRRRKKKEEEEEKEEIEEEKEEEDEEADLLKVNFFARAEFSLIQFCAELWAENAIKNI